MPAPAPMIGLSGGDLTAQAFQRIGVLNEWHVSSGVRGEERQ